ncbi:type II toxin-antitoxin system RelE/ParE family toxin [Rhizobium sp. LjRoot254]|uniref:type II toxin-antitoxin system RelE/ParE family toxin n=1 Tax=Rhizobium sp. LjRoot254 TaxID=3342297 RepID=UPI003ECFE9C0
MRNFRLSDTARADMVDILTRTHERFGAMARKRYERLIITALRDVAADPRRIGTIDRPELGKNVRSYHLRHSRERAGLESGMVRQPRHLLLYRITGPDIIGIGRVLHDAMELERHLPGRYGDE